MKRLSYVVLTVIIMFCSLSLLYSASLIWDPAGTNGLLHGLNIRVSDSKTNPSSYNKDYTHYNLDGFLGRFTYQGEQDVVLTFIAEYPMPSNSTQAQYFNFTKVDDSERYRRIFFVTTVKGERHNGNEGPILITDNVKIISSGDTLTIPQGAGSELLESPSSPTNLGYNLNSDQGFGPTYIYKYPYKYVWIDITVIRDTENNINNNSYNGSYTHAFSINGEGISSQVNLSGYRTSQSNGISYFLTVERTCPEFIPFSALVGYTTIQNTYPVGLLRYQSAINDATVSFYSNSNGTGTDFKFINSQGRTIDYYVVFKSQVPNITNPIKIDSTHNSFSTTNITFTSPTYGENASQKSLQGDVSIYLPSGLIPSSFIPGAYSSIIYVFVNAN
ncbi:MAG: hypothetical protein EOM67_06255 [Spirochaetia bacterium]|nr:hypothetical protein [Spirochaetia bacterium]